MLRAIHVPSRNLEQHRLLGFCTVAIGQQAGDQGGIVIGNAHTAPYLNPVPVRIVHVAIVDGVSLVVIGKLLGHVLAETTERYAHLADEAIADAAKRVSGSLARPALRLLSIVQRKGLEAVA